jgi:hypothetical protein
MTYYQKYLKGKIGCFSPPVMIATFVIEICLALFALFRYKRSLLTGLSIALFVCLAVFQLAEYFVCGGAGYSAMVWSRIGYASITMLPPLGVHIAYVLGGEKKRPQMWALYMLAAAFIAYFIFAGNAFTGSFCTGNYVIFQMQPWAVTAYTWYYYGLLLLTVAISLITAKYRPEKRNTLYWFIGGYAAFILPVVAVNIVNPETVSGIPSIMCGFAVLLAIIFATKVLPVAAVKK